MRVRGPDIDAQIGHLAASQRSARDHALDRLLHDPLGVLAVENLARRPTLDTAGISGVSVIYLVASLAAGQLHLFRIDDDDIVALVHVRGEGGLVLAAQAVGDHARKTPENQAVGVDQDPPLFDLGWLCRVCSHGSVGR